MTMNTCKADGCAVRIDDEYLMCKTHWLLVDQETRRVIKQLWAIVSAGRDLPDAVSALKKYREAVEMARMQVASRESAISHPKAPKRSKPA